MKNDYKIINNMAIVYIESPKYGKFEAIIDADDIQALKGMRLRLKYDPSINGYYVYVGFMHNKKWNINALHRIITNCPADKQVDHINRNPLDNRKSNLRICTNKENCNNRKLRCTNKSGVSGINWSNSKNKWIARDYNNGKRVYLGSFDNLADAKYAKGVF